MRKLVLFLLLCGLAASASAQGVRWDLGTPGSAGVTMITGGSSYPPMFAVPGAGFALCAHPANAVPCTNKVTTYTNETLGVSCGPSTQIVLQGSSTCQAAGANDGSLGVWLSSGGLYDFTLTIAGVPSGPYTIDVPGASGTATTPVTTPVSCPGSTLFPITSQLQTFAVTLTADCAASNLTAASAIVPPALVVLQITSNGHLFTFPSNSIGGATVAASGVTTQAFTWDGANATAIGTSNQSTNVQRAANLDATNGYKINGSFGTAGFCFQSTGSGTAFGPCSAGITIANAGSTGTTLNKLVKLTGAPSTALISATTDTKGILGVCVANCSTTGNATIQQSGLVGLAMDGATTAGDWVIQSVTVAGDGHDSGLAPPSLPPIGTEVLGRILTTNVGAGSYVVDYYGPGLFNQSQQGTDALVLTAGAFTGSTGTPVCKSANSGATTTGCTFPPTPTGVGAPQSASTAGLPVSITANVQITVLSKSVTFPSAAGTYRADIRSGIWITAGPNACASEVIDATNTKGYASANAQNANGSGLIGLAGAQVTSQTYTAGQVVTFNLAVLCNANSTATLNWALGTGTLSPNAASFLDITPLLTN